jgi:hypothetical protein
VNKKLTEILKEFDYMPCLKCELASGIKCYEKWQEEKQALCPKEVETLQKTIESKFELKEK